MSRHRFINGPQQPQMHPKFQQQKLRRKNYTEINVYNTINPDKQAKMGLIGSKNDQYQVINK